MNVTKDLLRHSSDYARYLMNFLSMMYICDVTEISVHNLQKNGGVFIKVGQHIGALDYLLPEEYVNTMKVECLIKSIIISLS